MYSAKKLPDDYEHETKKIVIEVPKNLLFMSITTIYEPNDRPRNELYNYNLWN